MSIQALASPDLSVQAGAIPVAAFGSLAVAGLCFSVGNAILEELVFRGVLFDALVAEWGSPVAAGVTALAFGLGHVSGYPPGPWVPPWQGCTAWLWGCYGRGRAG